MKNKKQSKPEKNIQNLNYYFTKEKKNLLLVLSLNGFT